LLPNPDAAVAVCSRSSSTLVVLGSDCNTCSKPKEELLRA
jgi:hypothetical protein